MTESLNTDRVCKVNAISEGNIPDTDRKNSN